MHTDRLLVPQGSDWSHAFPAGRDLTGWHAEAVIRHTPDTVEIAARPQVVLGDGVVTMKIRGQDSASWAWRKSRYEVQLRGPAGQRERFAAGRIHVDPTLIP